MYVYIYIYISKSYVQLLSDTHTKNVQRTKKIKPFHVFEICRWHASKGGGVKGPTTEAVHQGPKNLCYASDMGHKPNG